MDLDWIIQDPVDFEYKQYLILDYEKRVHDKLDNFELYPSFQELTILYTSAQRVMEHGQFITYKREPEEIDDEILLTDLIYNTIRFKDGNEQNEIMRCAEYATTKFRNLFMVAKSLWSVVNDSIGLNFIHGTFDNKPGAGYFYFNYGGKMMVYEYKFTRLTPKTLENKCLIDRIYEGDDRDVKDVIKEFGTIDDNERRTRENLPVFEVHIEQNYPLEGCLLSLIRRKVMNYVFQTVKINDLKEY